MVEIGAENFARGLTQTGRLTYDNTEQYIEVNGLNIHYHEAGAEHEHTVVFMHGGGLGSSGWFNFFLNIEPFSEHFRTILIDMPNFGRSDAVVLEDRFTADFDADILSEFLRLKGIERASLMGNSKGGIDAIAFSLNHTEQLELNVLMGAATGPSLFDVMPPHGTSVLLDIFRNPAREKVAEMMHLFMFDDKFIDEGYIDLRWAGVQEADRRGHREAILKSTGPRINYTTELHKVPNPTLVIYGAHDRFAALDSSVSLMRHYPNSQLHIFRNCGHWAQLERFEEFNELVINWMHYNLERLSKA